MIHQEKIFGIGLSKTGTTSLYAALDQLGFKTGTFAHMAKLGLDDWFENNFQEDYIKDYEALTDLPLVGFYQSLNSRYPNSRFIYTIREKSGWLNSCEKQFTTAPKRKFGRKTNHFVYGSEKFDLEIFSAAYDKYSTEIPSFFSDKPSQFLILDLFSGDGWEKLCGFLHKDIPDTPFPKVKPGFRVDGDPLKMQSRFINLLRRVFNKSK